MRARFGANNGSSSSLAVPAPSFGPKYRRNNGSSSSLAVPGPGFGSRLAARNGSAVSLALPGTGFGSRPGTPNKTWVNPLDIHFMRSTPSGPPTPRSPLGQSEMQLPPTPKGESDSHSIFGEEAGDMVDSIMATVKKKEQEEKLAKEKEKELEKQRETARLEMERLARQKSAESKAKTAKPSQQPQPQVETQAPPQAASANGPGMPGPVFMGDADQHQRPSSRSGVRAPGTSGQAIQAPGLRGNSDQRPESRGGPRNVPSNPDPQKPVFMGNIDQRPGSRGGIRGNGPSTGPTGPNGSLKGNLIHQGPPRYSPPTQDLPQPPSQNGHRRGPQGGAPRPNGPDPNLRGPRPSGSGSLPQRSESPAYNRPGPRSDSMPTRSESPGLANQNHRGPGISGYRSESPAPISPTTRGPVPNELRSQSPAFSGSLRRGLSGNENRSHSPAPSSLGPNGYRRQDSGSTVQSPSKTEPSLRELMVESPEPVTSETRPGSRSSDDGGPIEQFARPIIRSVQARRDTLTLNSPRRHSLSMEIEELEKTLFNAQQAQSHNTEPVRASFSSSHYSDASEDEPIVTLGPAPLRTSPPLAAPAEAATGSQREASPTRRQLALRKGPRRPTLDEYGVPTSQLSTNTRLHESVPVDNAISSSSRSNTPQFHRPQTSRSPASMAERSPPREPRIARPIIDAGFNFDFGPSFAAPPTPDSTSWPLASPVDPEPELQPEPQSFQLNRPNIPPPLTFNFSQDAFSRDPGIWTPPLRSLSQKHIINDGRPSTSQGVYLATAPHMPPGSGPPSRSRTPVDGANAEEAAAAAAALGIGMARGPSLRHPPGRKIVDSFGTGFI